MSNTSFFQFSAHNPAQGADRGFCNICDFKQFSVQLVSSAHGGDQRNLVVFCILDDGQLGCDSINGIYDIINRPVCPRKTGNGVSKGRQIIREHKGFIGENLSLGIDVQDPFLHNLCFVLSNSAVVGNALAVYVG